MGRKPELQNRVKPIQTDKSDFLCVPSASIPFQQVRYRCHLLHVSPTLTVGGDADHHLWGCGRGPGHSGRTGASSRDPRRRQTEGDRAEAQGAGGARGQGGQPGPRCWSRRQEKARSGAEDRPGRRPGKRLEPKQKQPKVERGGESRLGETVHGCPLEKRENRVPQSRAAGLLPSCP